MKITKTFENATLRTVNNGYIELDYNSKTHCFNNASVVSINNGSISIEIDWKPEKGELLKAVGCGIDCYIIFKYMDHAFLYTYGSKGLRGSYISWTLDTWAYDKHLKILPVTPEEQQAFDDFCKSQGKIWNKEKLQWEKYKWNPKHGEQYWYVASWGEVIYRHYIATNVDQRLLQLGNAFPTKEEAEAKLKQIKEILNPTI